ncbi:MAG: endonuclease V [Desulfobulbaceae bacterium]|jgi:deoxyribonuclease V|nr:endonuclease V [Desulfobulbaceae bacterium]
MKIALDVAYHHRHAVAGLVRFREWDADRPVSGRTIVCPAPGPYVPGEFYRRELPCLIRALESIPPDYSHVLIDGYVHLRRPRVKGLGRYLYEYLAGRAVVIGVAKSPLAMARDFVPVLRGRSRRPLYVSAMGTDLETAAAVVANMHGRYRLPTMTKLADSLARRASSETTGNGDEEHRFALGCG